MISLEACKWCAVNLLILIVPALSFAQTRPIRIAVLSFGASTTAPLVEQAIRSVFRSDDTKSSSLDFDLIDSELATSAARGAGYTGSLNLSKNEARDLGAAMGCDFYFVGSAETLRRSSSAKPIYYETYASIFLVSARTGRLISWARPSREAGSAAESLAEFMKVFSGAKNRYPDIIRQASEAERADHIAAVIPIIEVLPDDDHGSSKDIQAPRPYRRLKPEYPDSAARAQVEATVDALVDIDANGEIMSVELERWAGYGLDESVIRTVRQTHFFPAKRDGLAIPIRVLLRYKFRKPASQ